MATATTEDQTRQDQYHDGAHASTAIDDDHEHSAPAGHPEDSTLEPSPVAEPSSSFAAELATAALEDHDRIDRDADANPAFITGEPERYEPPRRIVHAAVVRVMRDGSIPAADYPTLYDLFQAWQSANTAFETIDLYESPIHANAALKVVVAAYRRFAESVCALDSGWIVAVSPVLGFRRANGDGCGVPLTTEELTDDEGRAVVKVEMGLERERAGRVAVATTAERTVV